MGIAAPVSFWLKASGICARAGERERARDEAPAEPANRLRLGVAPDDAARRGALRVGVCIEAMAQEELLAF